ncbi:hypothetical protein M440DRAFT_1437012 [Trichoderma longibrachiatum ATCC 18648]|uniref:FAD/NAD(P)-binding domain-containing protein n=1 Tax=Trichoderma longibrachiatum ATCC 18648 TaxID=983965 RepID=A0A2T4CE09_TRILO|nr:hypothetical protein M440DRAFT_1437012 [Trichoderma longibrachiatum ATCC 18648]
MTTSNGQKSLFGAHVVTRPNPDIAAGPESRKVLLHSFADMDEDDVSLVSYNNGFVEGIIRAFQQDLHLVLRPDDVWLATMVQFSFYVNGHAEEMRRFFVDHEGKKKLAIDTGAMSPLSVDFGEIAQAFRDLIHKNVVDHELTSWILPDFSTTTSQDITTTTLVMMATTKSYFEYIMRGGCGFPSVTLLGVRADWVKLLEKVAKIATYGGDLAVWSRLLTKVVEKMIKTFDEPESQTTKDFWTRAVHHAGRDGSLEIETLSGWITAFCRWDEKGENIGQVDDVGKTWDGKCYDRKRFVVDDVPFPIIRPKDIPRAATEVPIKVLDYATNTSYETTAIAGLVGVKPTASREGADGPVGLFDFSDLPMAEVVGLKNWDELPGIKVHEYLHEYARKFHLLERCKFSCRVTHIRRSPSEKGWTVETQSTSDDGTTISETFDCDKLIIATGNFNTPKYPDVKTSEFKGLVMHTKDIGQKHEALLGKDVETVAIYGGGKSAIDAVNLCIEAGKKVHWIISDKGNGPNMMFNTRLKGGFHVGQFVGRWKDVFSVSIFSVDTFFGRFFYSGRNRLGTWLIGKFWAFAAKKTRTGGVYAGMTAENREKLLPEGDSALFSAVGGAALHSCPKFIPELSKPDGLITIHRAGITSAQGDTVYLSNGESISCQALVFGTGWTPEDVLFDPAEGLSLGLRKPRALEDEDSARYWKKLHERADQEILSLLPILKDSPGPRNQDPLTPYRLYRYMLPSSLAAENDRSLVFLGYLISIQTHILSEVSALWAICWLEDLVDLGIPKSKQDIDYEIAKRRTRFEQLSNSSRTFFSVASSMHQGCLAQVIPRLNIGTFIQQDLEGRRLSLPSSMQ